MTLTVYADFGCPECYLASRRADALAAAGVQIDWCAVECAPDLPVAGRPLTDDDQQALARRFAALQDLLLPDEDLPWTMPARQPRTEAARTALAEASGAGVADDVRRLLFGLYWRERADIGSPNVLRIPLAGAIRRGTSAVSALHESGYGVAPDRGPVSTAGWRLLREWSGGYRALHCPPLPVVLIDGATVSGLDAVRRLGKQVVYAGASPAEPATDPRRYPRRAVRPGAHWVSQVGGPWLTAHRTAAR